MNEITTQTKKDEFLDLLKNHFGKELTTAELELFGMICKRTRLDPFIKQIYPVKRKNKQGDGSFKEVMVIQVGIDGFRSIAESTGCYAPGKEPSYVYDKEGRILSATAHIKKMTPDKTWHEVSATAFMAEYKPKYGNFWDNMPHLMLAKCAEALAIRKAFPAKTASIYTPEEMAQAGPPLNQQPEIEANVIVEKKTDPAPKEAHFEAISQVTGFEELQEHLAVEGLPAERLGEWIQIRCQMKNEMPEAIIKSCLEKDNIVKFKKSFSKWLEKTAQPEIQAV